MKFLDTYETRLGSIRDFLKPGLQVGQGGNVLESAVIEGGAEVPLGWSQPAQHAAEAMVVVVLREASNGCLGFGEAREMLTVENFRLEDLPERLDLAVGPGRADLGPEVLDVQVSKALAEHGQDTGHPDHERAAVVAHQLEGLTAELEALVEPGDDRGSFVLGQNAKHNHESRVVVDQANDPGFDVTAMHETDEKRPFDIDVPEFVWLAPLI